MRIGDPLSPLLFLVMMEVFSKMMKRAEGMVCSEALWLMVDRGGGTCVSHLLFVDDMILFCDAYEEQILYVRMLLLCLMC